MANKFATLDTYDIGHKMTHILIHESHRGFRSHKSECNMVLDLFNDYEMANDVDHYLFKANKDIGLRIIPELDQKFHKRYSMYIVYTDLYRTFTATRMVQGVWVFPDKDSEEKFFPKIQECAEVLPNSYIFKMPSNLDFSNRDWIKSFEDKHFKPISLPEH